MPPETTSQPLKDQPSRDPRDERLVEGVLGGRAAEEMDELVGDHSTDIDQTEPQGLELTEAETAATEAVEQRKTPEQRRLQYIEFAEKINATEGWVNRYFDFKNDGSVHIIRKLDLSHAELSELPPGLVYANGGLDLSFNKFTSLRGLPERVNGNLDLSNNYNLTSLEGLPKVILGDLYLNTISESASSIPTGLQITGSVIINNIDSELAIDCKAKGYRVATQTHE